MSIFTNKIEPNDKKAMNNDAELNTCHDITHLGVQKDACRLSQEDDMNFVKLIFSHYSKFKLRDSKFIQLFS